jgi:hypothetical protein
VLALTHEARALLRTLDRQKAEKVHEEDEEVKEVMDEEEVMEQEAAPDI